MGNEPIQTPAASLGLAKISKRILDGEQERAARITVRTVEIGGGGSVRFCRTALRHLTQRFASR